MAKEMVPILLSCAVWRSMLSKRSIEFKCDNRSVVDAIKKGLLKRCHGHASSPMSMVSHSHIRYTDYCVTHTRSSEHLSRSTVQEPTQAVPFASPTSFHHTNVNPLRPHNAHLQIGHPPHSNIISVNCSHLTIVNCYIIFYMHAHMIFYMRAHMYNS